MAALLDAGATQPAVGSMTDYLLNPPVPETGSGRWGQSGTTNPTDTVNLWLKLEMPTGLVTGTSGPQTMTLTVNGQAS